MNEGDIAGLALKPGVKIAGRYTVLGVLGIGGFGITYRCVDAEGRNAAVKEYFRTSLCSRRGSRMEYSDPVSAQVLSGMKAFVNEGKRLKSIAGRHPNIVKVNEVVYDNSTVYIVMDLEDGENLDSLKGKPMNEVQAVEAILPVVDAVAMLHKDRITHLDIKPGNIILSRKGDSDVPVLIDFGLSKHYGEDGGATTASAMEGCTPGYAPPEQYAGGCTAFSPQSDVYSLGATLYFLMVGDNPPSASNAGSAVVRRNLENAGVGKAMANVVAKAMSTIKEERQCDASELKRELEETLAEDVNGKGSKRPWGGFGVRRRVLAIVSAFAFVAIGAILLFMALGMDPAHPEEGVEENDSIKANAGEGDVGYSLYGEDIYEDLSAPGAMLNIDQMPVEPSVGEEFTVEIGVKAKSGIANIDSMASALKPELRRSEYEGVKIATRESGGDSLAIFSYGFRIVSEGTEEVQIPEIKIDGNAINLPPHRF